MRNGFLALGGILADLLLVVVGIVVVRPEINKIAQQFHARSPLVKAVAMDRFAGIRENIAAEHQTIHHQAAVAQAQVELVCPFFGQGNTRIEEDDVLFVVQ